MTSDEMNDFVERYAAAWASREPGVMAANWNEDGILHHPALSRDIDGRLVWLNNNNTKALIPEFEWRLSRWASSGETLFIAWSNRGRIGDQLMEWSGVDLMTVQDGKIQEETVYFDTYPLRRALDPTLPDHALVDADELGR
ncbi:MAG TPA: nuclear transport factor 2 family protein [Acidimicrobiales bacterium]